MSSVGATYSPGRVARDPLLSLHAYPPRKGHTDRTRIPSTPKHFSSFVFFLGVVVQTTIAVLLKPTKSTGRELRLRQAHGRQGDRGHALEVPPVRAAVRGPHQLRQLLLPREAHPVPEVRCRRTGGADAGSSPVLLPPHFRRQCPWGGHHRRTLNNARSPSPVRSNFPTVGV